jgi:hypothetical protein
MVSKGITVPLRSGTAPNWDSAAIERFEAFVLEVKKELCAGDGSAIADGLTPDRVLIVQALMEALSDVREELGPTVGFGPTGKLRRAYEMFRCELDRAGMPLRFETQQHRARGHRRLGQIAEARGDVTAAVWHYDMAVRCWRDVGCKRARDRVRRQRR